MNLFLLQDAWQKIRSLEVGKDATTNAQPPEGTNLKLNSSVFLSIN